ncbi:uncharacterized protein B0P05DRAFT_556260 [Gilbertella persicaria]|uniref:uncharacterized protein n=1 Tax=Gilbertella persicaria TaxID=101096 RepID=UPI002221269A|nr:uncharacterized protein B0P05DRAFT_556260 [Gilbertella persicaria]KAI8062824.1 hypothetical protein B0P05DRAFT_556260 [Gilbertella persicaria]
MLLNNQISLKTYETVQEFVDEATHSLLLHEVQNTFLLLATQQALKEASPDFYCNAVWDSQDKFVFALFSLNNTMLYGSFLPKENAEAVNMALNDFIHAKAYVSLTFIHGFQPALSCMQNCLQTILKLKLVDPVWSYDNKQVEYSPEVLQLVQSPNIELKTGTEKDMPLLLKWTQGFQDDVLRNFDASMLPPVQEAVSGALKEQAIYLLYVDDLPVSMAWKRRPTFNGIAITLVYTPPSERKKNYGSVCTGMLTELLLKKFKFVTLFVTKHQNPEKNLYTSIGFKFLGEAGRLVVGI